MNPGYSGSNISHDLKYFGEDISPTFRRNVLSPSPEQATESRSLLLRSCLLLGGLRPEDRGIKLLRNQATSEALCYLLTSRWQLGLIREDGGKILLRNVCEILPDFRASRSGTKVLFSFFLSLVTKFHWITLQRWFC